MCEVPFRWLIGPVAAVLVLAPPVADALEDGAVTLPALELVERARREGLPTSILEAKQREAVLKRVPEERARPHLVRLLEALRRADALVPPDVAAERDRVVSAAALALVNGGNENDLAVVLAAASDAGSRELAAQGLSSLLASGVRSADARALVVLGLHKGFTERLLGVRPALELLRASGYGEAEVLSQVADALDSGRSPLEVARERIREARSDDDGSAGTAAPGPASAPERDRSERGRGRGRADDVRGDRGGRP